MVWDLTTRVAVRAIDGLARRVEMRADNIANLHTPGFRARHLDFETNLRAALQRGGIDQSARPQVVHTPTVVGVDGNSVDLETELVASMRDALQRDAMTQAFNYKIAQLRVAAGGQR